MGDLSERLTGCGAGNTLAIVIAGDVGQKSSSTLDTDVILEKCANVA